MWSSMKITLYILIFCCFLKQNVIQDEDEIGVDQNDISEDTEDSLLSDRCCSTSSDETIECEDDCSLNAQDPQDDNVSVTENEDIITSAL